MSNPFEPSEATSLQCVQRAFEHWRHTRTQRRTTPMELRIQAVSLIADHRRVHICRALRINDQALKQWAREVIHPDPGEVIEYQHHEPPRLNSAFIELPADKARACESTHRVCMTALCIDLPNGAVIRTDQGFTLEQILSAACASRGQEA